MPDDKKTFLKCADLPTNSDGQLIKKLGGDAGLKTAAEVCHALEDGRIGTAILGALKYDFHDVPVHQFSSGETTKPADTPVLKSTASKESKNQGK